LGSRKDVWTVKKPCSTNPEQFSFKTGGGGPPAGPVSAEKMAFKHE